MKNIQIEQDGSVLTIKIDLSKKFGHSKSGKSIVIASTEGNVGVGDPKEQVSLGVNCYKKA